MHKADQINEYPQAYIDGTWVKARPVISPLIHRLKDALKVLIGKADAVEFYKQ